MVQKMVPKLLERLWQTFYPHNTKVKSYRTLVHPPIIRLKCHFSDELFITTGASFGVTLVSTALFEAGDMAFVADPTYFLVYNMLKMGKLNLTCGTYVQNGFIMVCIKLHVFSSYR